MIPDRPGDEGAEVLRVAEILKLPPDEAPPFITTKPQVIWKSGYTAHHPTSFKLTLLTAEIAAVQEHGR